MLVGKPMYFMEAALGQYGQVSFRDRRRETGDRRRETLNRRQDTIDRRRKTENNRQETGTGIVSKKS